MLDEIIPVESDTECAKYCRNLGTSCTWFSFNAKDQFCMLYSTCPSLNEESVDFISSQRECSQANAYNKILIFGGFPLETSSDLEVIDLETKETCVDRGNFDLQYAFNGFGGLLNGHMVIYCGGFYNTQDHPNADCFVSDLNNNEGWWPYQYLLTYPRVSAASVVINETILFISGGTINGSLSNTTEFVTLDGSTLGPQMPIALENHCMVKLNDSMVAIIGGPTPYQNQLYFLDLNTMKWTAKPDLYSNIELFGCSIFYFQENPFIMVAGGEFNGFVYNSVDIFDVANKVWFEGPNLLRNSFGLRLVPTPDNQGVIAMAGREYNEGAYQNNVWEFRCQSALSDCDWTQLNFQLKISRNLFVALTVNHPTFACN